MAIHEAQKQEQENLLKPLKAQNNKSYKHFIYLFLILPFGFLAFYIFSSSQTNEGEDNQYKEEFSTNYAIYSVDIPENLDFAGEDVPLENYDVFETIDREFLVNTYWQSQTLLFLKRANKYFPIIEPILKKNNIPNDFKYLAVIESGLTNAVSPSGAKGFWQFIKNTGEEYDLEINKEIDERYNIEKATQAACDYFNKSYKTFNNWTLVAASYNMGKSGLKKQLERQITNNYWDLLLNSETSRYVNRIIAVKTILTNPEKFGFHIRKKDLYQAITTREIEIDSTIDDLALFAYNNKVNYKILKDLNPWLRQSYLNNNKRKTYKIILPIIGYRNIEIPDSLKK
jgi:hypothetical protein